jgi:DNA polymerase-3 subunit beta
MNKTTTKKSDDKPAGSPGSISGTVDARQFTARLRLLKKFAERCQVIPILNCCTIEFDGLGFPRMKLSHYGLDMTMTATLAAEGIGAVSIPMGTLLAFVDAADGDTLAIEKKGDDSAVAFKCGRYTAMLVPLSVDDVPRLNTPDVFARGFALGEGVLSHLFALTVPFISTEETRYYLNGVCFELGDNKVRAVATDGHKLGTRETATPAPLEAWDFKPIVPRFTVAALVGIFGKAQCTARFDAELKPEHIRKFQGATGPKEETVRAEWKAGAAQFSCDGWTITSKLIDGTFPDWRRVVPKPPADAGGASIKAADIGRFAKMLKGFGPGRAVKVSPLETTGIRLAFNDRLDTGARHFDEGSVTGEAAADVGTPFSTFGVNIHYFDSVAKALGTDWVDMTITGPSDPFLLRGKAGPASDFAVLMPMRV